MKRRWPEHLDRQFPPLSCYVFVEDETPDRSGARASQRRTIPHTVTPCTKKLLHFPVAQKSMVYGCCGKNEMVIMTMASLLGNIYT